MVNPGSLLDEVMSHNQWHNLIDRCQKMTTETIYGHKKKVCLEQNISIGSIVWNKVISFSISPLCTMFLDLYVILTKAINGFRQILFFGKQDDLMSQQTSKVKAQYLR